MLSQTETFAAVGASLGLLNTAWMLWRAYCERTTLTVLVDWECDDQDGSFPRVVVRNTGGRTVYLGTVALVEANGSRHVIDKLENHEIKVGQDYTCRPIWDNEDDPMDEGPRFHSGWEGLRVSVHSTLGKEWRSRPPTRKPSWFSISEPEIWEDFGVAPT